MLQIGIRGSLVRKLKCYELPWVLLALWRERWWGLTTIKTSFSFSQQELSLTLLRSGGPRESVRRTEALMGSSLNEPWGIYSSAWVNHTTGTDQADRPLSQPYFTPWPLTHSTVPTCVCPQQPSTKLLEFSWVTAVRLSLSYKSPFHMTEVTVLSYPQRVKRKNTENQHYLPPLVLFLKLKKET